jgi:metal-dependent amidase/aminoacylase/carboxypeptidase family protein
VIPHEVIITGTIRTFDEEIRTQIHDELDKAFQIAKTLGGDYELEIDKGYPSMWNDPDIAKLVREVSAGIVGEEKALVKAPGMYGEDFSYMQKKAPGVMISLGAQYDEQSRPHHSPIFALGEDAFKYGTAVMAATAMRLLQSN